MALRIQRGHLSQPLPQPGLLYDQAIRVTCVVLEGGRQEWRDRLLFGVGLVVLLLLLLLRVVVVVVVLYDFPGLFCAKVNVNAPFPAAVIVIVIVTVTVNVDVNVNAARFGRALFSSGGCAQPHPRAGFGESLLSALSATNRARSKWRQRKVVAASVKATHHHHQHP